MSVIYDRVVALHGPAFLRKSAMNIRGGAGVFERALAGKGYRTAVEIGTYRGVAAAEMSQYVERVVTFDLKFGKLERNGTIFDRRAFWESINVGQNIDLRLVSGDDEKARILNGLDFDFAFIDGDHSGDAPIRDFELVKRCGRVLFHDYDYTPGDPGLNRVYNFVNSLPKEQVQVMDIFALWTAPC